MRNHRLYLEDILKAIETIDEFVKGMNFEEFKQDDKTSSAVIRKLEIIGEASKNIPEETKRSYPKIPWREMAGMRDKLAHFYFGIDYNLLWKTIRERLSELLPQIREMLDKS